MQRAIKVEQKTCKWTLLQFMVSTPNLHPPAIHTHSSSLFISFYYHYPHQLFWPVVDRLVDVSYCCFGIKTHFTSHWSSSFPLSLIFWTFTGNDNNAIYHTHTLPHSPIGSLISITSSEHDPSNKLTEKKIINEEWWRITIQVSIPFMIAGIGTIGAGILLGVVEVSLRLSLNWYCRSKRYVC